MENKSAETVAGRRGPRRSRVAGLALGCAASGVGVVRRRVGGVAARA